ncbi:3-dehydroquinate synthase [Streptomyces beijiangensis]|uniref:3-dehydroquinate synthase n=1 Tax=Streptomyces beijiangensis TaxID=163361 RepID=A0A939JI37_9ACTN|nr:3-dehydroquinate synthase [Streptomyces beijiangensis]MBO0513287.1 3-dehydroquinate synthase [Streptomyces beijiangensis]
MTAELTARFTVTYRYGVHFTTDALHPDDPTLAGVLRDGGSRVLAVLDAGLLAAQPALPDRLAAYGKRHSEHLEFAGEPIVLPAGERAKDGMWHGSALRGAVAERHLDRHAYVLAIGGGAILDAAGFAAATAHRGIRLIRMPSTVLAQADAGIGVKNGVNACGQKNFIGTFTPPRAVINDTSLLSTLSDRDWRSGTSEAVKIAALKDAEFFDRIEADAPALAARDSAAMHRLIRRCAQLHLEHITGAGDPFETGSGRPLDFGHWAAHKLEQLSGFRLRHGEAVALGVAIDTTYAHRTGLLPKSAWRRVMSLLAALGFQAYVPELADPRLPDGLGEFAEHIGGPLTLTTLTALGRGIDVRDIDLAAMTASIHHVNRWAQATR